MPARLAVERLAVWPGVPSTAGERVGTALKSLGLKLILLALGLTVLAVCLGWLAGRWPLPPRVARALPVLLVTAAWLGLYLHNAGKLPITSGFDARGHLEYIEQLRQHGTLPRADQGWQAYQPPLFYLAAAGLLKLGGVTTSDAAAVWWLRGLTFTAGLAQVLLLFAIARRLWPDERRTQLLVLGLAACLPLHLYLFHYASNETLATTLGTAASYLLVRLLQHPRPASRSGLIWAAGAGLCLGAALLTKVTALLLLPAAVAVLAVHVALGRHGWRWTLALPGVLLVTCLAACGWHYLRIGQEFGNPLIGNWDPALGFRWWQDPGYRTAADFRGALVLGLDRGLTSPWYGGFGGIAEGFYTTLWGDGLAGGETEVRLGPPWNHGWMAAGFGLALVPLGALLLGAGLGLARLVRAPSSEWWYLAAVAATVVTAWLWMVLKVPSYAQAKAFYAQPALPALVACFGLGAGWLGRRRRGLGRAFLVLLGLWACAAWVAVWVQPEAPATRVMTGLRLLQEGQPAAADQELAAALVREPNNAEAHLGRYWALAGEKRWDEARAEAEAALAAAPQHPEALMAAARENLRRGDLGRAEERLRRAVALAPGDPRGHGLLMELLLSQRRGSDAIVALRRQLAADPQDRTAHLRLAALYHAAGERAAAVQQLRYLLALAPDDRTAQAALRELTSGGPP